MTMKVETRKEENKEFVYPSQFLSFKMENFSVFTDEGETARFTMLQIRETWDPRAEG